MNEAQSPDPPEPLKFSSPWGRISEVAARLGVPPHKIGEDQPSMLVPGNDEQMYDLWKVVSAFLDKVDALSKELDSLELDV